MSVRETADGFTDAFANDKERPFIVFQSYWEQWKAKNKKLDTNEDLYLKLLLGRGDRPDIGAGLINMSADLSASSSGSSSGAATTISNLGSVQKEKQIPIGGSQHE